MFMENNENPNQGGMNSHHMKKYMYGNFWVKILVMIIVLIAVFKLGVCVGEFKAHMRGFSHHGGKGMMHGGTMFRGNGTPGNVMYFEKNLDGKIPMMQNMTPPTTQTAPAPAAPPAPAQ